MKRRKKRAVAGRWRIRSETLRALVDGFEESLVPTGSRQFVRFNLIAVVHFVRWLEFSECGLEAVDESTLVQYRKHFPWCRCAEGSTNRSPRVLSSLRRFLAFLRTRGMIPQKTVTDGNSPAIVQDFLRWVRADRGVTDGTLAHHGRFAADLVSRLGASPQAYTAHGLRAFVEERCRNYHPVTTRAVMTTVRLLVQYLACNGLCRPGLDAALPPVVNWATHPLPQGLTAGDIEKVISSCPSTNRGVRDKAILLLLVRLGLRAGDVDSLRFEDLNFQNATIRVVGKGRREAVLPLPQDVGDAILTYVRQARPRVHSDFVFLRSLAPFGRLKGGSVPSIARAAQFRAGVKSSRYGSHVLRHTAAGEMLRQGSSLEDIAAILRHRSVETTKIYAKVDIDLLRSVAQPWPVPMEVA